MVTLDQILPYEPEVVETFKTIHKNPEPGFCEHDTARLVAQKLAGYGLSVRTGVALTGVLGELDSGRPGKTVLLRADMDALPVIEQSGVPYPSENPGMMHACGHDGHVAMLLGAARYLAEHRDSFSGKVRFAFQPAEEGKSAEKKQEAQALGLGVDGGAQLMIAQGATQGVDACFAIHVNTLSETGTVTICQREAMSAADHFELRILGSGGHGSSPHNASDPISALAAAITAIQGLPARSVSALERCVVNIGTLETPGSRFNIIPARVVATGTVRTYNPAVREKIFELMAQKLEAAAALYGCTGQIIRDKGYDAVVNDPEISARVARAAQGIFGAEGVQYIDRPDMGSEDVGYFFAQAPGALAWLGAGRPAAQPVPLHSPFMQVDPDALKYGVALHVNAVLELLGD